MITGHTVHIDIFFQIYSYYCCMYFYTIYPQLIFSVKHSRFTHDIFQFSRSDSTGMLSSKEIVWKVAFYFLSFVILFTSITRKHSQTLRYSQCAIDSSSIINRRGSVHPVPFRKILSVKPCLTSFIFSSRLVSIVSVLN